MTEREPLLRNEGTTSYAANLQRSADRPVLEKEYLPSFFFCFFALELCIKFGATLLELPNLRLVEHMVCNRYFETARDDRNEEACKIPVVQNKLAFIIGYKATLDALPCLLTVLMYGSLSNRWGRKFVIMLQITGRLLALLWIILIGFFFGNVPAQLLWISSLFLFIGGGRKAEVSMVYTSFCDIVPEAKRTRLLALVHAAEGLAGIFSYPASSFLMAQHLWAPFALAVAVSIVEYTVLWYTPETSPFLANRERPTSQMSMRNPVLIATKEWWKSFLARLQCADIWSFFQHRGLNIIFLCFFCKRIAFAGEDMVPQWVSEILHRRISETYAFQAFNHFGMLLTLSMLVPLLTCRLKSPGKDLWVIYGSLVNVITGFLILWGGRSISVIFLGLLACGLGEGFDVGLQSLGSYIVGEKHYGTFFPFASMLGVAGELLGGPLMATTYAFRDENGAPLGYCFLFSAVVFTCLFVFIPQYGSRRGHA